MLKDFLKHQYNHNDLFFNFHSFFNIESGFFAIGSFPPLECEDCDLGDLSNNRDDCASCGRSTSEYLVGIAGDGDGIYTVWEIWDNDYRTIGVIAVLDSGYRAASAIRTQLEGGEMPDWDDDFVSDFLLTKRMIAGVIEDTAILRIGETGLGVDTSNAVISVLTGKDDEDDFEVSFFVEQPGQQTGPFQSEKTSKPRVILALRAEVSDLAGREEIDGEAFDWQAENQYSMLEIVASHQEPMGFDAALGNFMHRLVELKNDLAEARPEAIVEQTKRFAGSWALFIKYHFDEDGPEAELKKLGFKFRDKDYPQMLALASISDDDYRFESGAKPPVVGEGAGPKFCQECGSKRGSEAKFCAECGKKF